MQTQNLEKNIVDSPCIKIFAWYQAIQQDDSSSDVGASDQLGVGTWTIIYNYWEEILKTTTIMCICQDMGATDDVMTLREKGHSCRFSG